MLPTVNNINSGHHSPSEIEKGVHPIKNEHQIPPSMAKTIATNITKNRSMRNRLLATLAAIVTIGFLLAVFGALSSSGPNLEDKGVSKLNPDDHGNHDSSSVSTDSPTSSSTPSTLFGECKKLYVESKNVARDRSFACVCNAEVNCLSVPTSQFNKVNNRKIFVKIIWTNPTSWTWTNPTL